MSWWSISRTKVSTWLFPRRVEHRIDEEIRFHLEALESDLRLHGAAAPAARRQALQVFGNPETIKNRCADVRRLPLRPHRRKGVGDMFLQDIQYAFRSLVKRPGFTAVATITLALGIGANTAIFSLVNGVLLSALPFEEADRLVAPTATQLDRGGSPMSVAYPEYLEWSEQKEIFEDLAAIDGRSYDLTGDGEPERVGGNMVSEAFFRIWRARPLMGRTFSPDDFVSGNQQVLIISEGLWQRRFGADPEIIGKDVRVSERPYTVIGVVKEDEVWPRGAELWTPMFYGDPPPDWIWRWDNSWLRTVARLQPGVEIEQARAVLVGIAERVAREMPAKRGDYGADVIPLQEWIVGETNRTALLVLLGAVGFVLLIACVNVSNLLIARAAEREHEIAVRRALGAGRADLLRQLLAESLLLASLGALGGLLMARWGINLLLTSISSGDLILDQVGMDGTVFLFVTAVAGLSALLFGVLPTLVASRTELTSSLNEAGRSFAGRRATRRARSILVVAEVTLSLMLLVGAGLMIRSLTAVIQRDPGIRVENMLMLSLRLPGERYPEKELVDRFFLDVTDRIEGLQGVESAASMTSLPLGASTFNLWRSHLEEGRAEPPAGPEFSAQWNSVMPGFFHTLGIPILQGRAFTDRDDMNAEPVMMVSQSFADEMFPGRDPIGVRIRSWRDENLLRTIVGVVGDVRQQGMSSDINNIIYVPRLQLLGLSPQAIVVHTSTDPLGMVAAIRGEIWNEDPDLPISNIQTFQQAAAESLGGERAITQIMGFFAFVALTLAAVGLYGLISYSVTQRTREIGLRMALGADARTVLSSIVRQALVLAVIGMLIGLAAAFALSRVMANLLYDISPADPLTYISVSLVLVVVAGAASLAPALRATRVDPVTALRSE
jgi:putative ABC transport system permease protein